METVNRKCVALMLGLTMVCTFYILTIADMLGIYFSNGVRKKVSWLFLLGNDLLINKHSLPDAIHYQIH